MKRGFSLVEMLIALALTAVALAIIAEGVRQTVNFEQRLAEVRQEREAELSTLEAVRGRLERLVPAVRPAEGEGEAEILFDGQAQSVVFIAADPGYPSAAGLYEYRLRLTGGDDDEETGEGAESGPQTPQLIVFRRPITDLGQFNQPSREDFRSWTLPLNGPLSFGYATGDGSPSPTWQDNAAYPSRIILEGDETDLPAITINLPRPRPEREEESTGETTQ